MALSITVHGRSARRIMASAAVLLSLSLVGCGGNKAKKESSAAAAAVGEPVQVEGMLSLRGSTPYTTLLLEVGEDEVILIQSKTIQAELNNLSGMKVLIEGESMPSLDGETPVINALRYRMLRLPSGELPILGVVSVVNDLCFLDATDGKRYWIRGDFTGVISDFTGAKIWMIGALGDSTSPDKPQDTTPYWVTGYGVLSTH